MYRHDLLDLLPPHHNYRDGCGAETIITSGFRGDEGKNAVVGVGCEENNFVHGIRWEIDAQQECGGSAQEKRVVPKLERENGERYKKKITTLTL